MKRLQNMLPAVLALLMAACLVGWFATRDTATRVAVKPSGAASQQSLMDDRLVRTAVQMAPLSETVDEANQARAALRLADHELDQAFATALREAETPDPKAAPANGPVVQLKSRVAGLTARVAAGAARVAQLTKDAATKDSAADALEVARAQLELDRDDLEDAQQDLARQGGDTRSRLERALQQHQAAAQQTEIAPKAQGEAPTGTLLEQFRAWLSLSEKARTLLAAEQQATARSLQMEKEHNGLESKADTAQPAPAAGADTSSGDDTGDTENVTDTVARLRKLSDQRKTLAELDKRIQDTQQLAGAYQTWATLVETRRRAVLHLLLRSLGGTLGIVLAAVVVGRILKRILLQKDRRSQHQLRVITNVATQGLAAVFILLIVFGPPSQLSTILGLTTAGLTVVLKDFIVAFIGWFVLMGRNGVRVGDWVEIEGVGGEVIEIGVLKTILLEMGNWTTTGHPTGRRVSFMNGYAMGNHYFNFSTGNQWLWDELQVTLPATGDPYKLSQQIYQVIEHETETDAAQAEQDWERVTHQYGIRPFTAKPAVDLRPGPTGLDVVVRYITRAPQRYEVKSKLFQSIVELLHGPAAQVVERS